MKIAVRTKERAWLVNMTYYQQCYSWNEVNGSISDEMCASKSGIHVQYLDDEDDWITVCSYYLTKLRTLCRLLFLLLGHQ